MTYDIGVQSIMRRIHTRRQFLQRSLGAPVGAHTDAVLSGLGYPEERIAELRAQGAVG